MYAGRCCSKKKCLQRCIKKKKVCKGKFFISHLQENNGPSLIRTCLYNLLGKDDGSGRSVYHFIRDLIQKGKDARFVNKEGRYVLNWSRTLERYASYKSKSTKNNQENNGPSLIRICLYNLLGKDDGSGRSVYHFIRDLIQKEKDARFVNKEGRYVLNWSRTLERYASYRPKSKKISRREASNALRTALLNTYKKDGAKEYLESRKSNDKGEVIQRKFQMPHKVFESLFGSKVELPVDSADETSRTTSEVHKI